MSLNLRPASADSVLTTLPHQPASIAPPFALSLSNSSPSLQMSPAAATVTTANKVVEISRSHSADGSILSTSSAAVAAGTLDDNYNSKSANNNRMSSKVAVTKPSSSSSSSGGGGGGGSKMMLKSYGAPLLPKTAAGTIPNAGVGSAAAMAANKNNYTNYVCNTKAFLICQACGAFCHDECLNQQRLCISCVIK